MRKVVKKEDKEKLKKKALWDFIYVLLKFELASDLENLSEYVRVRLNYPTN